MSRSRAILATGALALLVGLGACGKRGAPIPPDGATYPRQYPAPRYVLPESAAPEPALRPRRQQEDLQFFQKNRVTTKTYEPIPPAPPEATETPATPEETETPEETGTPE